MLRVSFVCLSALVCACLLGCGDTRSASRLKGNDFVDRDFEALISTTKEPSVFHIEVRKTNQAARKMIGGLAVQVDLTLRSVDGRVYSGPVAGQRYAEEVGAAFYPLKTQDVDSVKGKVRLVPSKVPPGTYTVEPRVRIYERGPDAVRSDYNDMGSVAVPAARSVKVTIK